MPLFVTVYETIYNRLLAGDYLPGEQLPGESELAKQLKVSRGTLRQALLLLQEDGMIINRQGKGSFVLEKSRQSGAGIERLNNPLISYSNAPIDQVKVKMQFQAATDKHRERFGLEPSALMVLMEIVYYAEKIPAGLAQVFIPYSILSENQVPLDNEDAVYGFYNKFIRRDKLYSDSKIRLACARTGTAGMLKIKEGEPMMMMEENVYQENRLVIFQKYFMRPNYYELRLQRYNDRHIGNK